MQIPVVPIHKPQTHDTRTRVVQNRGSLKNLYRPLPFFGVDFLLTWIPLWIMAAGLHSGRLENGTALLVIAGSSSTLAAILFVLGTRNRRFIRDFWIRVTDPMRIRPSLWGVILFSQGIINILAIFLSTAGGASLDQLTLSPQFLAAPIGFLVFTFVFGPLPEEIGWRGYGLDALRSRMNLLRTSLLLAGIWAVWHLPMVFIPGSFQNGLLHHPAVLVSFFFAFLPCSILMSWIYYRTGRSTLSAILFHFAGNFSGEFFSMSPETRIYQTVLMTLWAGVVLWREWPLFSTREFWLDFSESQPPTTSGSAGGTRPGSSTSGTNFSAGKILLFPFLLAFLLAPQCLKAESEILRPSEASRWETAALPYCFYTTDTGIAGGGMMSTLHFSNPRFGEKRGENSEEDLAIRLSATWSWKNQKELNLSFEKSFFPVIPLENHWKNGSTGFWPPRKLLWIFDFRYSDFPGEFYGTGTESSEAEAYTAESIEIEGSLLLSKGSGISAGPLLYLGLSELGEITSGGSLSLLSESRPLDGCFAGGGTLLRYDSRNNPRTPSKGLLLEVRPVFLTDLQKEEDIGTGRNSGNFVQLKTDLRAFSPLGKHMVSAFRISGHFNSADPPLQAMAELGGLFLMRGYPAGRFLDRNGMCGQLELRFPLYRRTGGVLFGAAGTVFSDPSDLLAGSLKCSGGIGLRYALTGRGDTRLRVDFGITEESTGVYITLMEAF